MPTRGGLITRDEYPLLMQPRVLKSLKEMIWDKKDDIIEDFRNQWYTVKDTTDPFWQTFTMVGMGNAQRKPEGTVGRFDKPGMGRPFVMTFPTWSLGVSLSREAMEDDAQDILGPLITKELKIAMNEAMEEDAVAQFNDAFTFQGWESDGQALVSTSHPIIRPGIDGRTTWSNRHATDAALSISALDAAYTTLRTQKSDNGRWLRFDKPVYLDVHPTMLPTALRILQTERVIGSNYNDKNLYYKALQPRANPRLTNQYSWFLTSDDNDFMWMNRVKPQFITHVDDIIDGTIIRTRARWGRGAVTPRGVYGSYALA
jgi:hypothetical protein